MAFEKESEPLKQGRISLLKVPLDIIPPNDFPDIICKQLIKLSENSPDERDQGKNIVLLSLWDLLKARRNAEYRNFIIKAFMVAPISKSLIRGAVFLKKRMPQRYMPFHFIIGLLGILESMEYTIYLLGGNEKLLKRVEKNISQTFPRLRIVGRRSSFHKQDEELIVEAIRKTAPQLLLVGRGVRGDEMWIVSNSEKLNQGLRIWCSDIFEVFTEKKSRPGDRAFALGLDWIFYLSRNPFRVFRIFPFIYYNFLLLFYRLFRKN